MHTRDLARALAFYSLLGLDTPPPGPTDSVTATDVTGPQCLPLTLTWGTTEALRPLDGERVEDPSLRLQIEIGYDNPTALDTAWSTTTAAGHPGVVTPFDAPWGVRFAVLTDPDGNRVALTAPLNPPTDPSTHQEP